MRFFYNQLVSLQIIKFLVAGSVGITVNLFSFYVLLNIARIPYLFASVLALSCSTVVGFVLQKYWTFRARIQNKEQHEETVRQFVLYAGIAILNLGLDALVVYTMVDVLSLNKFLAQATAALVVAFWSFFLYKNILFIARES